MKNKKKVCFINENLLFKNNFQHRVYEFKSNTEIELCVTPFLCISVLKYESELRGLIKIKTAPAYQDGFRNIITEFLFVHIKRVSISTAVAGIKSFQSYGT